MFKLLMSHTELQDLYWTMPEFSRLVKDQCIIRTDVWLIVLQVKLFGKSFYIPLCGIEE